MVSSSIHGGAAIDYDGRRVFLKWHRLRRRMADPLFDGGNLRLGLRLGASMEVDLRMTSDFDFAVLHDAELGEESAGTGLVAAHGSDELARLCYRDPQGGAERPVLMLGDLAALAAEAHPDAMLQLDMKDGFEAVGQRGVERLVTAISGSRLPFIVSGDSIGLIVSLAHALPELSRGIDPTDRLVDLFRLGDRRQATKLLQDELAGPAKPEIIYLSWQLLLHARDEGVDLVGICHDAGKRVDAWTYTMSNPAVGFSDREWREFSRLLELEVDQITTDEAIATERAFEARRGARLLHAGVGFP
jgi:glycerophosphoryl diester phosphodiesterase